MKFLIQHNADINIAPIINTVKHALGNSCEIGFFSNDVNPEHLAYQVRPDIIMYYDNQVSAITDLLSKLSCVKIEHVVDTGTQSADFEFSLTNMYHPNFFAAHCNTFILQNPTCKPELQSDISFLGPPTLKSLKYLNNLLRYDYPHSLRIYGRNKYHNWKYCGIIEDGDVEHIFASTQCVPVFDNNGMYDSRVLDAIYCNCIPIIEHNTGLINKLGEPIQELMFTTKEEFHVLVDRVLADPTTYKNEIIPGLRKEVINKCTWYDTCATIFKSIGLKQTANTITAMKRAHIK
jgi:hypothetical protein